MSVKVIKVTKNGCRPCQILGNILQDVDFEEQGVELVEINADDTPGVVSQYELMSVPALIFERNGVVMARHAGIIAAEEVIDLIKFTKEAK